jgi:DNA-binding transcriptional MerR regulator
VRYYVQEGLLPAPLGIGRGDHYGREHLDQLLKVKALQEAGHTLDEIRRTLSTDGRRRSAPEAQIVHPDRSLYRRMTLAPGVELHVASDVRLPSPGKLIELTTWCRLHFPARREEEEDA